MVSDGGLMPVFLRCACARGLFGGALAVALVACGDGPVRAPQERSVAERRLEPRDLSAERQRLQQESRVFDAEGALLPSNNFAAGVQLPRGLHEVRSGGGAFYYNTRASLAALRAYFGPRLVTGEIKTGGRGTVTYVNATTRGDKQGHVVSVRIGPAPANPRESQVYIREVPRNPIKFPSEAQVKAQIEARRKYAD